MTATEKFLTKKPNNTSPNLRFEHRFFCSAVAFAADRSTRKKMEALKE